jgi:hypothetical protein
MDFGDEHNRFEEGSFEAARMLVSRLQSEVYGADWDAEPLGLDWLLPDATPVFETDEGVVVTFGDMMLASLSMILSLFAEAVELSEYTAEELVARMGVGVAELAPEPEE